MLLIHRQTKRNNNNKKMMKMATMMREKKSTSMANKSKALSTSASATYDDSLTDLMMLAAIVVGIDEVTMDFDTALVSVAVNERAS